MEIKISQIHITFCAATLKITEIFRQHIGSSIPINENEAKNLSQLTKMKSKLIKISDGNWMCISPWKSLATYVISLKLSCKLYSPKQNNYNHIYVVGYNYIETWSYNLWYFKRMQWMGGFYPPNTFYKLKLDI